MLKRYFIFYASLVIFGIVLIQCDARRGGGGSRGGGSRGGGWGSSRGSSGTSRGSGKGWKGWFGKQPKVKYGSKGYTPQAYGRNVIGNYQTFGQQNRWSMYGGRSLYFVGFPYGYHSYEYRRRSYGDDDDDNAPINPWTAMIIFLFVFNLFGFLSWLAAFFYFKAKFA